MKEGMHGPLRFIVSSNDQLTRGRHPADSMFVRSAAALLLLLAATPAASQAPDDEPAVLTTRVAAAVDATVCACDESFMPTPRQRDLVIVAVGLRIPLTTSASGRWALAWVPELIPFLYSNRTADGRLEVWSCGPRQYCGRSVDDDVFTVMAFGAGVMPVGALLGMRMTDRVHVRARVSGGAVQLSEPVPLAQGTKFNFLADGSVSVEFRPSSGLAVSAGFVLNHISNGGLGRVNLGMDSRMFEIGAVIGR